MVAELRLIVFCWRLRCSLRLTSVLLLFCTQPMVRDFSIKCLGVHGIFELVVSIAMCERLLQDRLKTDGCTTSPFPFLSENVSKKV